MGEIKAGDIVRLKLGGREMVVASIGQGFAKCYWWNGNSKGEDAFELTTLEHVPPKSSNPSYVSEAGGPDGWMSH